MPSPVVELTTTTPTPSATVLTASRASVDRGFGHRVGLGDHHDWRSTALPRQSEETLELAKAEGSVECIAEKHSVDVGGHDLGRRPLGGSSSAEDSAAWKDGRDMRPTFGGGPGSRPTQSPTAISTARSGAARNSAVPVMTVHIPRSTRDTRAGRRTGSRSSASADAQPSSHPRASKPEPAEMVATGTSLRSE